MRVAAVEPAGRLYGSELCLLEIIESLPEIEWHVLTASGNGFDQMLLDRDIETTLVIPTDLAGASVMSRLICYSKVWLKLKEIAPDVLYLNQTGILRAASIFGRLPARKIVCQVQTLEDAVWLTKNVNLHELATNFICNSKFISEHAKVPDYKKSTLYLGQRDRLPNLQSATLRSRPRRDPNTFMIGILGRIAISKGHYVLLDAAKLLASERQDFNFVVIGSGLSAADDENFRSRVADNDLADCFEFRGYRRDVTAELERLDVLVIPSIAEPFGRIYIDAAENGIPVVVSDGGGLGELNERFKAGRAFKSEDPHSLAAKLIEVRDNYDREVETFRKNAERMLLSLDMTAYASRIRQIIEKTADGEPVAINWYGEPIGGDET